MNWISRIVFVAAVGIAAVGQCQSAYAGWIDSATGQPVQTNPVTGDTLVSEGDHNGTVGAMTDPDHAYLPHTGQNLHWVPCPPLSAGVNTTGGPFGHDGQPSAPPTTPPPPTPTHRQTSCTSCQKAADRLNKASDQLAQDLADSHASPETIDDDRSLVKDYSKMLDDCEKHCKDSGGLFDHVTIGVGVDVGGGHDHHDDHSDHHSDHSDVP